LALRHAHSYKSPGNCRKTLLIFHGKSGGGRALAGRFCHVRQSEVS
jgi:hypothetical protein